MKTLDSKLFEGVVILSFFFSSDKRENDSSTLWLEVEKEEKRFLLTITRFYNLEAWYEFSQYSECDIDEYWEIRTRFHLI